MEKLSHAINQVVEDRRWKPITTVRNGPTLSHLFFADDILLFSKASTSQTRIIAAMFKNFAQDSSL